MGTIIQGCGEIQIFINENDSVTIKQVDFCGEDVIVVFPFDRLPVVISALQALQVELQDD